MFLLECSISSEFSLNGSVPHSSSTSRFLSESVYWMLIVKMSKNVVHDMFILYVVLYLFMCLHGIVINENLSLVSCLCPEG
jgi:hypothetical protein